MNRLQIGITRYFLVLCGLCSPVAVVEAGFEQLAFDQIYSVGDPGLPSGPALRAVFQDIETSHVRLTLENLLDHESEHIKQVNFNLDPTLDPTNLVIQQLPGGPSASAMTAIRNRFKAGSAKAFDIELAWQGGQVRFEGGSNEVVVFDIFGSTALTAESFLFFNDHLHPTTPNFVGAIHVGGIGPTDGSAWVGASVVPPALISRPRFVGVLRNLRSAEALRRRLILFREQINHSFH